MISIDQLYERAKSEGIDIIGYEFEEIRAIALPSNIIGIDYSQYESTADLKCDIAHEIGHCETGSFYNYYSPYELWEKCEHKANRRAVEILMPLDEVRQAVRRGIRKPWALAEHFEVTQAFAEMALEFYEDELQAPAHQRAALPPMMRARDLLPKPKPKPVYIYAEWQNDVMLNLPMMD